MLDKKYIFNLKSGSDIRGTAIETDDEQITLTDDIVYDIVNAYIYWMCAKLKRTSLNIALGHDSRLSADRISEAAKRALLNSGASVYDCGLCSTPSMFMMTKYPGYTIHGSVMVTASHHPWHKNGLKFFNAEGGLESGDIGKILEYAATSQAIKGKKGKVITGDFMKLYCDNLIDYFRASTGASMPLSGMHIVVDAGNGAGGFFATRILEPLGADISGSQYLEPDGLFPNHVPNPENGEAMKAISECVLKNKADIGIIFDTDVDRAALVGPDGMHINRNTLIALISAIILEDSPGATIVTDSVTSEGLTRFLISRGGEHHRFKRGYKNIINEAIELNQMGINTPLAIETSGHAALRENYFLDDGAYLVICVLVKMCRMKEQDREFYSLLDGLTHPREEAEVRINIHAEYWYEFGLDIIECMKKTFAKRRGYTLPKKNYDGIRIRFENGFFQLRMSVHDPVIVVNMESDFKDGIYPHAKEIYYKLKHYKELDLSGFYQYVQEIKPANAIIKFFKKI